MDRPYILNLETGKIELFFEKEEYLALPEDQKNELKRYFRFNKYPSRRWASKAKEPNLHWVIKIAKKLGFTVEERRGERLSYAEQVERKAERAEARADRFDDYAANAEKRAESLQSAFDQHRGDIAFMTQPITPGAGGRAFKNYRDRIVARYDKGMDEYRKSEYFRGRAATSRETASTEKYRDLAYLDRRISEQRKTLKALEARSEEFTDILLQREQGDRTDQFSRYSDEDIGKWIASALERIEVEADKLAFYLNCLEESGGFRYGKDNIKPGYIVLIRGSKREIIKANPKTVDARCLQTGMVLNNPYAEIQSVVEATEKSCKEDVEQHPYKVGDILVHYNVAGTYIIAAYQVVKTTTKMIEIRELVVEDGEPQADTFKPNKPVKRSKPYVRIYDQQWYVSASNGWALQKYFTKRKAS